MKNLRIIISLLLIEIFCSNNIFAKNFISKAGKSLGHKMPSPIKNMGKKKHKQAKKVSLAQAIELSQQAKENKQKKLFEDISQADELIKTISLAQSLDDVKSKQQEIDLSVNTLVTHLLKKHDQEVSSKIKENLTVLLAIQEGLKNNILILPDDCKS